MVELFEMALQRVPSFLVSISWVIIMNWFQLIAARFGQGSSLTPLSAVVDILLVAVVFYKLIMLAKGTRAWQIIWGLGFFFIAVYVANRLNLRTVSWLLVQFIYLGPVALVILFYPELRQVLEELGRLGFWGSRLGFLAREDVSRIVDEIVRSAGDLSVKKIGALVMVERETGLDDMVATGRPMDSLVSAELLGTIFYPGSPLHDGAVIIRGNRIAAAACLLPLTDRPGISSSIHMRHRAALGASEISDAAIVVVSEETGAISLSYEGKLVRGLSPEVLRDRLTGILQPSNDKQAKFSLAKLANGHVDKAKSRL